MIRNIGWLAFAAGCMNAAPPPTTDPGATPDGADTIACGALTLPSACSAIVAESRTGLVLVEPGSGGTRSVALAGLATGRTCTLASFAAGSIAQVTALASLGTDVFYCAADAPASPLTKVSLVDGSVSTSTMSCLSVTTLGGKLHVLRSVGSTLAVYASWADVMADHAASLTVPNCAIRLGASETTIYSAWPSPSTIDAFAPPTTQTTIALDRINLAVAGISASGGQLIVLDASSSGDRFVTFATTTGATVATTPSADGSVRLHGLALAACTRILQ